MSPVLRRLGTLPVERFMARYWQRQPACLRQVLPGFASPIGPERLFELARDPDVESRLVSRSGGRWHLRHGPIAAGALPARRRPDWSLLVQGVDLHEPRVAELAARFRFLPAARFDDVMVSFATDGGGVGPHVDAYDVFLLQAQGRRRWRIARQFEPRWIEDAPLRVLSSLRHEQEWVLEPGDLLYLPPGVAHEGVALGDCVTISVGFRLPAAQEIAEAWNDLQAREAPLAGHLADRARRPTRAPARLPAALVEDALRRLQRRVPTRAQLQRALLENLTEPKPNVYFDAPRPAWPMARFARAARRRGLRLDLRSRLLYEGRQFAMNGEIELAPVNAGRALQRFADLGMLGVAELERAAAGQDDGLFEILYAWYRSGWIHLAAN
jgi:50S ribosomal protein L16 3-hydroxylase